MKKHVILFFILYNQLITAQFELGTTVLEEVVVKSKLKKIDLYIHKIEGIDSLVKVGTRIVPEITIGNKGNSVANKKEWSFFYI